MADNCPLCGNQMPEKRIYKRSEVEEICKDLPNMDWNKADGVLTELKAAMHEGRIQKE